MASRRKRSTGNHARRLSVKFKLFRRDIVRSGKKSSRLFVSLIRLILIGLMICGGYFGAMWLKGGDRLIVKKLTYPETYDSSVPYFRTLNAIGSSNHLCVSVKTANIDNLHDRSAALTKGGVNIKISFSDGTMKEIALLKRFRHDNFTAGQTSDFIVTLPYGYTPFDISETSLVLTAGADGKYDDWSMESAEVSFLLTSKRMRIFSYDTPEKLGGGNGMLRAVTLNDNRQKNDTYRQMSLLFDKLCTLAKNGLTDFTDASLKTKTLSSLQMANATALYMDVETVSTTRSAELRQNDSIAVPDDDEFNFNGTLQVTVTFNGKLPDGGYTKTYTLDTPGKDDFELSARSTFRMEMPQGLCVFDIASVTLTTSDISDAWSPRFVRLYLTLDYEKELELARLTDSYLEKQFGTPIFYRGLLDTPIPFDLTAQNSVPAGEKSDMEKQYGQKLTEAAASMYFENQSYYSRQIRFFSQMDRLLSANEVEQ